jgi:hypothetical protein
VWTLLAAFWLWLLLPVAIYYQRKARREAEASPDVFEWRKTVWNRPILLWLIVFAASLILIVAMVALGIYGDPAPR